MRKALSMEKLKRIYGNIAKRYDFQHSLITFRSDQKGGEIPVGNCVKEGGKVWDFGSGMGITGIMAARNACSSGKVTLFDLSEDILSVARGKVNQENIPERIEFQTGDIVHLQFDDNTLMQCFQRTVCVLFMIR